MSVEDLSYGRYYWVERQSPSGFVQDTTPHYFEITEDGQTVEVSIVNYKPDIPNTSDVNDPAIWYLLGGLALCGCAGSVVWHVREIKKDKNHEYN